MPQASSRPAGFHSAIPYLIFNGTAAKAIAFYCEAFEATELPGRLTDPAGRVLDAGIPDLSSTDLDFIERHVHFFRLVEQLPEIQRRVVCERFVEERSIREIARRLDKTEGAVKQLQFRALQTLRAQIGDRRA